MLSKGFKGLKKFFLNPSRFRLVYLLTLFFTNVVVIREIALVAQYVLMPWAGLIIYFYYIRNRRIFKIKYVKYLILYLVSCTVTALININSNFGWNMLINAHIAICFFVFYGLHTEKNRRRIYREINILAKLVILFTTVLNICAFPFACMSMGFELYGYECIIYENRLTGFFINPNLLGFISAVSIIFAHMLTKAPLLKGRGSKNPNKWLLFIASGFNLVCLYLSDSNASFVFLVVYALTYVFFRVFKERELMNWRLLLKKTFSFIAMGLAVCIILVGTRLLTGYTVSLLAAGTQVQLPDSMTQTISPGEFIEAATEPVTFKHQNKNLDSGRIRLLMEAAIIFINYPLFGMGKANLVPYAQQYIEGGLHFSDLHNGYVTILVCSGIVGFVIFLAFAIHLCRHMVKSLFMEKKNLRRTIFPCLFSFIFSYCVYSLFEKALLYEQSFMVLIFWAVLGYASVFMLKYDHINDRIRFKFNKKEERDADYYDAPTDIEVADEELEEKN